MARLTHQALSLPGRFFKATDANMIIRSVHENNPTDAEENKSIVQCCHKYVPQWAGAHLRGSNPQPELYPG